MSNNNNYTYKNSDESNFANNEINSNEICNDSNNTENTNGNLTKHFTNKNTTTSHTENKTLNNNARPANGKQSLFVNDQPFLQNKANIKIPHSLANISTLLFKKDQYHAAPNKRILLYGVVLSVILLIFWAGLAKIDSVARGMGQVVPSQRIQKIQNLEGGILEEIYVKEGQIVNKGQIIVRLNNETADSQFRDAFARSLDARAAITRLEAEIKGTEPQYSENILKRAPELTMRHNELLKSRMEKNKSELDILETQKKTKEQELNENKEALIQLNKSLKMAKQKVYLVQPLMSTNSYSQLDFLALKESVQHLETEIGTITFAIPRLETAIMEANSKLTLQQSEQNSRNYNEIIQLETELISLNELITAGNDRVTRTEIRSPVQGIVQRIDINTLGGVVKPGENIMTIIPNDDLLVIEAKIRPEDIAFIYPNQKAIVKLSAYDFSIYGGLEAHVVNISADTLENKQGEIFYLVKVNTKDNEFRYNGKSLPILPGMMAQVDILTGKKSILEYLLKPILKIKNNALRER